MKVLQAWIYNSVITGLFLKSLLDICQFRYAYGEQLKYYLLKRENKPEHIEFGSTCGYKLF